ncbi:MAG TPA: glycosyltransferase family 39 protein, partial [Chthoniobacterales bacterium]
MSRGQSLLVVFAVWAIGYIPALGSLQLRGEESRRVLPAIAMMEGTAAATTTREVIRAFSIPQVGGRAYLRKPPLVNWLIAASFKLSGQRNAWAARLPSALFVLAVAIAFVTIARPQLGAGGSIAAAVSWLTSLGILQKGRMIEIDAIYTSLFALALIYWLTCWLQKRATASIWIVPLVLLGLALLAKGPAVLLFFYALTAAVLWRTDRLPDLVTRWHALGLVLMLAVFGVWAAPLVLELGTSAPVETWWAEMFAPVAGREVLDTEHWVLNLPRGATLFLPAALLLPFIRYSKITERLQRETFRALAHVSLAVTVVILILPGSYPKYAMPLIPAMCWIIGTAVANDAFVWPGRARRVVIGGVAL